MELKQLADELLSELTVMRINLSENRRIVGTKYAWELQRRRIVKGEACWRAYKWFRTFGRAVQEAVHAEIRQHPATTLVEAIKAVDTIVQRYARLIPCEYEIRFKDQSTTPVVSEPLKGKRGTT